MMLRTRKLRAGLVGAVVALGLGVLAASSVSAAATFTVTNTNDSGAGSLRQAIIDSNGNPGTDTIAFNIPGAFHTITPTSQLPEITDPATIDGTTEPDFAGSPIVELDGSLVGGCGDLLSFTCNGLTLGGGSSTVRGLVINRFGQFGIALSDCCAVPPTLGDNVVQGNFIGTDVTGTIALGNLRGGVLLHNTIRNLVGGTGAGEGNLISGNVDGVGVWFFHPTTNQNLVQGNLIGTQKDGSSPLGNALGMQGQGSANVVGGTVPGAGNTIAFNGNSGIDLPNVANVGNAILGNSIFSNAKAGIDLISNDSEFVTANDPGDADSGPNNLQNFPVLTSATSGGSSTAVQGTLNSEANKSYRLEFFSTPECDPWRAFAADEFGHGEGKTFIGSRNVTTDGSGDASFTFTSGTATPLGHVITSTATDPDNNTSEFSMCRPVDAGPGPPATVTLSPADAVNNVGTTHTVTATVKDTSDQPVPDVTVRFSVTGATTTSGSCVTNTSGQCSFSYQGPNLPGADLIDAYADTDDDNVRDVGEPVAAATKAWVLPTSTPGQVTGGGQVPNAAANDKVAFGFNAKSDSQGVKGECTVVDPSTDTVVKCLDATTLVVSATHATIFGNATVNGTATTYRIDVDDLDESGVGKDTFTIQTGSGYTVGGTLTNGNVQVH